jgi:SAM-dependent methyltransferase
MKRSLEPELMDAPDLPGALLEKVHRDLARIHWFLGSYPTIERFIRHGDRPVRRVLDIGCGGGDLLRYLRRRMGVEVIGVDPKPGIVSDVPVIAADATRDALPKADIAVCSLVAHHLTPEENIALIRNVARSCRRFLILDLIRHPMPLVLYSVFLCPFVGKEAAMDGKQSIRRAFTPAEFGELAKTALAGTNGTFSIDVSPFLSRQVVDIRFE